MAETDQVASPKLANAAGPLVGPIVRSDSDWPTIEPTTEVLAGFRIPFEVGVVPMHRTPERMVGYAKPAAGKGLRCIIANAGGTAYLPGMVASTAPLPVIDVPCALESLESIDSLLSIVQIPSGVPVVTVGVDGAKNAGLLAMHTLLADHPELIVVMRNYQANTRDEVLVKDRRLRKKLMGE